MACLIQFEKLNQLAETYDVDILCGYSLDSFQGRVGSLVFQRICAEHSAVHSRGESLREDSTVPARPASAESLLEVKGTRARIVVPCLCSLL